MTITLLHTADIHRATYDALRDSHKPGLALTHIVRPDLLDRARAKIDDSLIADIADIIAGQENPVVCTCTTIAPIATRFGATRADAPMMQAAAADGGDVLLVYTVAATQQSSLDLLNESLNSPDHSAKVHLLGLTEFWPLFEAGEQTAFEAAIAAGVKATLKQMKNIGVVVLAQGSMAGAAAALSDVPQNVLTLPDTAIRHIISLG